MVVVVVVVCGVMVMVLVAEVNKMAWAHPAAVCLNGVLQEPRV